MKPTKTDLEKFKTDFGKHCTRKRQWARKIYTLEFGKPPEEFTLEDLQRLARPNRFARQYLLSLWHQLTKEEKRRVEEMSELAFVFAGSGLTEHDFLLCCAERLKRFFHREFRVENYLNPVYFETLFHTATTCSDWPAEFAILSTHAPNGQIWPTKRIQSADRRLEAELRADGSWLRRIIGYSPKTSHEEPSFAVELPVEEACKIGRRYYQDAIFFVIGDKLFITLCDRSKVGLVFVGKFRKRVRHSAPRA